MICMETRHAKAAMKAQQVKTDRNDARGLAHMMRTGWYKEVHIKSHDSQELRMLLNNRRFLLDKRLDTDNEIRGSLRTFGLKLGKVTPATYDRRIRELVGDNEKFQALYFPDAGSAACADRAMQEAGKAGSRLREEKIGVRALDDDSGRRTPDSSGIQDLC